MPSWLERGAQSYYRDQNPHDSDDANAKRARSLVRSTRALLLFAAVTASVILVEALQNDFVGVTQALLRFVAGVFATVAAVSLTAMTVYAFGYLFRLGGLAAERQDERRRRPGKS